MRTAGWSTRRISPRFARYELTGSGTHNAQVMAKVERNGSGWSMTAIGAIANGRTFRDLLPAVTPHL